MKLSTTLVLCALLAAALPARCEESAWTLLKKGITAYEKKDARMAKSLFEGAIRMSPGCEDAYYYLGAIANEGGDPKTAAIYFAKVTEKYPTYSLARSCLGQIAYRDGDKKLAAEHFAASVAVRPSSDGWMQLATTQMDLKLWDASEAALKKAEEFTKNSPVLSEMWARLFLETKRFKEALERYTALSAQFPRDSSLRFMRGACLDELKRGADAVVEYQAVLQMDPFHANAIRRLLKAWDGDESKAAECEKLRQRLVALEKNPPKVRQVSGR